MKTNEPLMPTDEQREQFDSWARTQAWTFGGSAYDLAFAVWLARDAEVQALREALTTALIGLLWGK